MLKTERDALRHYLWLLANYRTISIKGIHFRRMGNVITVENQTIKGGVKTIEWIVISRKDTISTLWWLICRKKEFDDRIFWKKLKRSGCKTEVFQARPERATF
jgi:hypothetical protein